MKGRVRSFYSSPKRARLPGGRCGGQRLCGGDSSFIAGEKRLVYNIYWFQVTNERRNITKCLSKHSC